MRRALLIALFVSACGQADFEDNCQTITSEPGADGRIVESDGDTYNILGQETEPVECERDST